MSFAAGFQIGNRIVADIDDAKRQKVLDERAAKEFARKEADWARADKLQRAEDAAFSDVEDLQRTGQVVGANTSGFSDPSARMLHGEGGQKAVDDAASYANVENRRFGLPATHTTSGPSEVGASPVPTVTMRQATELDRVGAMERLATARRDVGAMERLAGQRKAAQLDLARKAEVSRLEKLNDDEFLGELKKYINPNADVPAMLGYDPKSKRFTLVSDVPGVPTQTLSRAELLQGALGAWEMGKGDYAAGLQMMLNTGKTQRELSSGDFDRSVKVASLNQKADNDAGQLRIQQQNADTKAELASMKAVLAAARGGATSGLNMDALDKQLAPLFAVDDPVTGKKSINAQGMLAVRNLAMAMPSAAKGDATGAAMEAYNAYTVALGKAGGDPQKAVALLQQAMNPAPAGASPAPASTAQKAATPPTAPAPAPYVPPADSPAGKAKASREAAAAMSMEKVRAASDAAQAAIASKDPAAAQAVQDMPGFVSLPAKQKAEIRSILFGR